MAGTVLTEVKNGVRTIILNRPDRLNAISGELLTDFKAVLAEAEACRETRAIVLTGAGRSFCAGDDLKEFTEQARDKKAAQKHIEDIQHTARALMLGRHMVVGAIHGWAAGGGLEWAINCDLVLMAESTRCFFPEIPLGLNVTGGVSTMLPRLVGLQKARELILFGEKFGAQDALSMGIAWKVVPDTELRAEAQRTAERIAALPQGAVSDLKQLLNRASAMDVDGAMALETEFTVRQFLDPETQTRAKKFAER